MAGGLRKLFKKVPYLESLRAFFEQWGIWSYIVAGVGLVIAALTTLWGWLVSNLPVWGIAVLFLGVLVLVLACANYAVDLYRKITAERIDHDEVADSLIKLSDEMRREINDYARDQARRNYPPKRRTEMDSHQEWQAGIIEGDLLVKWVMEKFGSRIMASIMLLDKLGVKIPFHMSHMSNYTVMGLSSYFGAVGHLIKNDQLAVAQKLDDQAAWTLSGLGGQDCTPLTARIELVGVSEPE